MWRRPGGLRHQRLQSVLAVAAIAAAVSLPVVLLSVGGGVSQHEIADLADAGYEVVVSASGIHSIAGAHDLAGSIDRLDGVAAASPVLSIALDAFVGPGAGPQPVLVEGVIPSAFSATEGSTERSLFPSPLPLGDPGDRIHFANGTYGGPATWSAVASAPFLESSGASQGTPLVLSQDGNRSHGVQFNVTGVFGTPATTFGPAAAYALVVPLSDLQVLSGLGAASVVGHPPLDSADTIQVALLGSAADDPAAVTRVASEVQSIVPFYGVSSLLQQAQQLEQANSVLTGFYLALSSVSLSVGLIFLALVQVRRVESERRWVGVRRAIGVPARFIAADILRNGAILAGAGAVVGTAGGVTLVLALRSFGTPEVAAAADLAIFDPTTLVGIGAAVVGLSLLAGALATRTALKLSIPEALR